MNFNALDVDAHRNLAVLLDQNISDFIWMTLDTETTGLKPKSDQMVELAAVSFDEDFEQRRFQSLIKPTCSIPTEVIKIHGITDEMVASEPPAEDVLAQFSIFAGAHQEKTGHLLFAHNAAFDWQFMVQALPTRRSVVDATGLNESVLFDTAILARALLPDGVGAGLGELCQRFNVDAGRAHRAMSDALALRFVLLELLKIAVERISSRGGFTVKKLMNLTGGVYLIDWIHPKKSIYILSDILSIIYKTIQNQSQLPLKIRYNDDESPRYVIPQRLLQKSRRLYLDAWCCRDEKIKRFRTERIWDVASDA